jgi:protein-disulfide isomerase
MNLTDETKLVLATILISITLLTGGMYWVLRPPPVFERTTMLPSDTATRGNKEASVYLVEFSDFQCPACKSFTPLVEDILKKYGEKIVFAYRHFPLPQHPHATYAAQAFEAAHDQKKGWEMYKYLFTNQSRLSKEFILDSATVLGLDTETFSRSIDSQRIKDKVLRDMSDGKSFGVNSTPTFFLNGKRLDLFSQKDLLKAVDEALQNTTK